jgi:hypothetical protein
MIDRRPHASGYLLFLVSFWWNPLLAETPEQGDPASLAQLHDIVVAAPVAPWWPLAPGWYLLAGLLLLLAGWGLWRMLRRRRARRYRVEALAQLHALCRQAADPHEAVAGILVLLKRTALAAYPRVQVASLNGAAWWRFLDLSGGKTRFAEGLGDLAEEILYARKGADKLSESDLDRLCRAAGQWIRQHRLSDHQSVTAVAAEAADDTPGSRA